MILRLVHASSFWNFLSTWHESDPEPLTWELCSTFQSQPYVSVQHHTFQPHLLTHLVSRALEQQKASSSGLTVYFSCRSNSWLRMLARKNDRALMTRFIARSMALKFSFQLVCAAIALWFLVLTYWSPVASLPGIRYRTGGGMNTAGTNSTLGFQKIYAISLPQRTDRQDALTLMSVLSGLEIDIAPGVRGEDALEKTVPKVISLVHTCTA